MQTAMVLRPSMANVKLTTDHAQSSYGMPVLVVDGVAYGQDDMVQGLPARNLLRAGLIGWDARNIEDEPDDARALAELFFGK